MHVVNNRKRRADVEILEAEVKLILIKIQTRHLLSNLVEKMRHHLNPRLSSYQYCTSSCSVPHNWFQHHPRLHSLKMRDSAVSGCHAIHPTKQSPLIPWQIHMKLTNRH